MCHNMFAGLENSLKVATKTLSPLNVRQSCPVTVTSMWLFLSFSCHLHIHYDFDCPPKLPIPQITLAFHLSEILHGVGSFMASVLIHVEEGKHLGLHFLVDILILIWETWRMNTGEVFEVVKK